MEDLRKEKGKILLREHLGMFLKVFVFGFMLAAIFFIPAVILFVNAEITLLKEQATTANERRQKWEEEAKRQTELAEKYRDRFLAITKTNAVFSTFTDDDLRVYALRMVKALQIPIREQEAIVNQLEGQVLSAMHGRTNVYDFQKTLEERSTGEWEAGQKCMAEYNIRFKTDVLMLRREILSRIPVGNDVDQKGLLTDYWYDSPWNFYGFKKMVLDLDRITRQLPVTKGQVKK